MSGNESTPTPVTTPALTRQQLKDRLKARITASQFKRLPTTIREDQMDQVKQYMEQIQEKLKSGITTHTA